MIKKTRVSAEDFIKCWQCSASTLEVAEKLQMRRGTVIERARLYRMDGIPLRRHNAQRNDRMALVKLALDLGGTGD